MTTPRIRSLLRLGWACSTLRHSVLGGSERRLAVAHHGDGDRGNQRHGSDDGAERGWTDRAELRVQREPGDPGSGRGSEVERGDGERRAEGRGPGCRANGQRDEG